MHVVLFRYCGCKFFLGYVGCQSDAFGASFEGVVSEFGFSNWILAVSMHNFQISKKSFSDHSSRSRERVPVVFCVYFLLKSNFLGLFVFEECHGMRSACYCLRRVAGAVLFVVTC